MALTKDGYKKRLIDDRISEYLSIFGALSIEGPKWCGKTWTALNHSNSVTYLTNSSVKNNAKNDPVSIFEKDRPQLIDEWQLAPNIWDAVRYECDADHEKGKFILTGSTTLDFGNRENDEVFHSGAGRIATLKMAPMSLYESGDSTGSVSLIELHEGKFKNSLIGDIGLEEIANLIIRGGWPENMYVSKEKAGIIPESYINAIINRDIHERKDKRRNKEKMRALLRSLARNESTIITNSKIVSDIEEYETNEKLIKDRETLNDYLSALDDLYLIENQKAYGINYRSSKRVGKYPKRHLVDPSLACALLNLTKEKLINDHATFGLLFESLVERDLRIYMNYLGGELYHFRDNSSGDEVDAILEFKDGSYAAVEIKLSFINIEEAKRSLMNFYNSVHKKPKFMAIIVGNETSAICDKETGIYIFPITALKP